MKLICTASKVSWFTVGREYEMEYRILKDDHGEQWLIERHNGGYRTEMLEDAEFSIAQADDKQEHEAILAEIRKMAQDEGCEDLFQSDIEWLSDIYNAHHIDNRRAFLLALAYFAEEKSQ
ncbi:MAG: hypothetical protein ACRCYS_18995 [Beijerinckiaceae bacterium]